MTGPSVQGVNQANRSHADRALSAIRDSDLCTDRRQLDQAWRDLIRPDFEQGELV